VRKWILLSIGVPLAAWLLKRVADQIGARRGESTTTRLLRLPDELRRERKRGHDRKRHDRGRWFRAA
jgi:hypothetical protein